MELNFLIRSMRIVMDNEIIRPEKKASSGGLGIRGASWDDEKADESDIIYDKDFFVHPMTGGLSVSVPPSSHIPAYLLKKKQIFFIDCSVLNGLGLKYRQDPNKETHYLIEPICKMLFSEYEQKIDNSWKLWKPYIGE